MYCIISAMPTVFSFFLNVVFLSESPHYLVASGQNDLAADRIRQACDINSFYLPETFKLKPSLHKHEEIENRQIWKDILGPVFGMYILRKTLLKSL